MLGGVQAGIHLAGGREGHFAREVTNLDGVEAESLRGCPRAWADATIGRQPVGFLKRDRGRLCIRPEDAVIRAGLQFLFSEESLPLRNVIAAVSESKCSNSDLVLW